MITIFSYTALKELSQSKDIKELTLDDLSSVYFVNSGNKQYVIIIIDNNNKCRVLYSQRDLLPDTIDVQSGNTFNINTLQHVVWAALKKI